MMAGHYAVAFVTANRTPRVPLWHLFVAVQFVDILFVVLALAGLEEFRLVPGITAANPLDLIYIPFSHSLTASVVWAIATGLLYQRLRGTGGLAIGLAVLSHWFLDLPMHLPDLPLYGDEHKVGLGLWNAGVLALALECALVLACAAYHGLTRPTRWRLLGLAVVLCAVQVGSYFGPLPPSTSAVAISGLVAYLGFAAAAAWADRPPTAPRA